MKKAGWSNTLLILAVILGLLAFAVVACGGDEGNDLTSGAMSYTDAKNHLGETGTFTGPVLEVTDKHTKWLIVLGTDTDDPLNLNGVITADDLGTFGGADALNALIGQTVEITGEVRELEEGEGVYEMALTDPSQLVVTSTGGTVTTIAEDTTGSSSADVVEGVIDWTKAADYVGKTATVTGPVVGLEDEGEAISKYLVQVGATEDGEGFNAMIWYDTATDALAADQLQALVGTTIEVTGEIYINEFESKPEIEVSSPDQLVVK